MPRISKADPAMLDRLRAARAAEDTALVTVTAAQAALDAAVAKRTTVLATLDEAVAAATGTLSDAHGGLVDAAGLDRAALALGLSPRALRKQLPNAAGTFGISDATTRVTSSAN